MTGKSAHGKWWQVSQFVLYPLLACALIVESLRPSSFGLEPLWILRVFGALLLSVGVGFVFRAHSVLRAAAQPSLPGTPTTKLIRHDVFGLSRNPTYLGALIGFLGLSLLLNSLWVLAGACLAALLLDRLFVVPEESYLMAEFGDEFSRYRQATRRWL